MAEIQGHRRVLTAVGLTLAALWLAPARAEDQKPKTDLYDRPVLTLEAGAHSASIWSLSVDTAGRYAVTGGYDRTVRIWSVADGKLVRTIRVPIGPENIGHIYAVAISPDGSTVAAGGWTGRSGNHPIYIFDSESGKLIKRIAQDLQGVTEGLTFSRDGRFLAAVLDRGYGLRVFETTADWPEAFADTG